MGRCCFKLADIDTLPARLAWVVCLGMTAACSQPTTVDPPLTAEWVDAERDMALYFDGTRTYASTGTASFPFALAPQTLSCWLAREGTGGVQSVLALHRDLDSGVQLGLRDGALAAWRTDNGAILVVAETPLDSGEWQHAAYVYEGEPTLVGRLYIDGVEVAQAEVEMTNRTPSAGFLGTLDGTRELFHGRLDEVRIWSRALTPSEVAADMARTSPGRDPSLVAYYTFDEAGGPWGLDRSGHGNHAVLGDGLAEYMPQREPVSDAN
jgi:hypothetical protein